MRKTLALIKQWKPLHSLAPTQIVALGFLFIIILGGIILSLPISSVDNTFTPFIDSLFTATSAVCITGLTVVDTAYHWNTFGQVVIMLLIQIGGIGFMSMVTMLFIAVGKKITLKQRIVIQESFNLSQKHGLVSFTIYIFKFSIFVELVGAILLSLRFIPEFGLGDGLFKGVFHSISAFCNAGFDILGSSSLESYYGDYIINITIMLLIIIGGLGFPVCSDICNTAVFAREKNLSFKKWFRRLRLHSKIALLSTGFLIVFGTLFFLISEHSNADTIGLFTFPQKVLASLFQSVTLRTAGFASISQGDMNYGSKVISIVLMFVGGSPAGTAGGVKTVTMAIIFLAVLSIINGDEEINFARKNIPMYTLQKALAVMMMMFSVTIIASILLSWTESQGPFSFEYLDLLFEVVSAQCTVGLTTGITHFLSPGGKIILIICMYIGRLGPISVAVSLTRRKQNKKNNIHYLEDKLLVG